MIKPTNINKIPNDPEGFIPEETSIGIPLKELPLETQFEYLLSINSSLLSEIEYLRDRLSRIEFPDTTGS